MKKTNELVSELSLKNNLTLDDIPNIDLYMDQVIQLFENSFSESKRNDDEKVLTKTMINNYAKGKLFFPIENKKYSKEHLILISLIYQLKGVLSIQDIKTTLTQLNEIIVNESVPLHEIYQSYLGLSYRNAENFKKEVEVRVHEIREEVASIEENHEYLERVLTIASFVNISNLYKRAAEKLVDDLDHMEQKQQAKPGTKIKTKQEKG